MPLNLALLLAEKRPLFLEPLRRLADELLAVCWAFEEWLQGFFEVDAALGAFKEKDGIFVGECFEEGDGLGGGVK